MRRVPQLVSGTVRFEIAAAFDAGYVGLKERR